MTQDLEVPPEAAPVPADSTPAGPESPCQHVWGEGHACVECGARLTPSGEVVPNAAAAPDSSDAALPSYLGMFREYVAGQRWITPAHTPLVFHLERLCRQLDANPDAPAAVSSAYLQAFTRLEKMRPGSTLAGNGDGLTPPGAQRSIFDEMED